MGTLLLVDDEIDILDYVKELFTYEIRKDIDVYTASSAKEAIALLESIRFDVVMTDVKMPNTNGLELFQIIKENWPQCRVIFLTGFRDFDVLYELQSNPDVQFLLKSENDAVIIKTVLDSFSSIENMLEKKLATPSLEESTLLLRAQEYFLKQLTQAKAKFDQKDLDRLGVMLIESKKLFLFLIVKKDEQSQRDFDVTFYYQLQESLKAFCGYHFNSFLFQITAKYYMVVLQPKDVKSVEWNRLYINAKGAVQYVQEHIITTTHQSLSFVLTDTPTYLENIREKYEELKMTFLSKNNEISQSILETSFEKGRCMEKLKTSAILDEIIQLDNFLRLKNYSLYFQLLEVIITSLKKISESSPQKAIEIYHVVMATIIQFSYRNELQDSLSKQINFKIELENRSFDELLLFLLTTSNHLVELLKLREKEMGQETNIDVLSKLKVFIDEHLSEDLSLEYLADTIYMNPSYLSRTFKQRYKKNLSEYITAVRMDKARKLLLETKKKINEISKEVGYNSSYSFTRVFKRIFDHSPQEYREKFGEEKL